MGAGNYNLAGIFSKVTNMHLITLSPRICCLPARTRPASNTPPPCYADVPPAPRLRATADDQITPLAPVVTTRVVAREPAQKHAWVHRA
eukprot:1569749-Pleurochrysis_carterae.AAC.3